MAFFTNHPFSQVKNLNVKGRGGTAPGIVRFNNGTANPALGTADYALYVLNGNLIFEAAQSETTLGAAGAVANFSMDDAYDDGSTLTVDSGAVTLAGSHATNNVLAITGSAATAGNMIDIQNSGSGFDIQGTDDTWSVSAAGAAIVTAIAMADNQLITLGTGSDATIGWNGTVLNIAGVTDFDNNVTLAANATITQTGVAGSTVYTITAGDVVWSDASLAITDADNAESVTIINNTATTIGAAATAGIVQVESTSLTTGALINAQLTEGTLNGGFYYSAWDATASARVWSIGEDGRTTIAGAGGANVVTVTAGDFVVSDGSLTMTDADNAASLSITNDTATTANVFLFTGSGVFTGTGATSFFDIVQSGANSGDVVNVQADGLTTGTALRLGSTGTIITTGAMLEIVADSATSAAGLIRLTADALTTGFGVLLASTSVNLAAGQLLNIDHTASGAIVAKTGQLIDIVSSRDNTAAAVISDDYDALSIIRTNINTNAGGTLNAAGSVLRLENVGTETAGTLADTAIGLEVVMTGGATQDGNGVSITHTGTTAGQAIDVIASQTTGTVALLTMNSLTTTGVGLSLTNTGTGMTSGSVLRVASGTTSAVATNGVVSLFATGAFTSTAVTDGFVRINANSTLTGTAVAINGNSFTTGVGLYIGDTGAAMTSGSLIRVSSGSTGAVATNGIVNFVATAAHTSTAGVGFVNVSDATATGNAVSVFANALTTGSALLVSSSGTITSAGEGLVNIVGTGITTGDALKIDLTEGTLAAGLYINCYDDTAAGSVFTVGEDGNTTITGAAGSTMFTLTAGDLLLSNGAMASAREQVTLGAAAAAIAVDSNVVEVTGDGGGNTVTTITGGVAGQVLVLIFVDGNVTINDDDTHGNDSVDLVGANTTFTDDATLTLVFDGTSWYEVARSIND